MGSIVRYVRGFAAAIVAGALGGALLGVGESSLVTWTSAAPDEYWLFLFGAAVYGLIGAGLGLAAALLWQVARRGAAGDRQLAQIAVGVAMVLPVFAVGRYHVAQRLFEENLPTFTPEGIAVHLLLGLGALLAAAIGVVV